MEATKTYKDFQKVAQTCMHEIQNQWWLKKAEAQLAANSKNSRLFNCDDTPSALHTSTFFNHFSSWPAGDQLVVPIGVTHISLPLHQIQSREQEKKEQTNNMLGVNSSAEGELCNTAFPIAYID